MIWLNQSLIGIKDLSPIPCDIDFFDTWMKFSLYIDYIQVITHTPNFTVVAISRTYSQQLELLADELCILHSNLLSIILSFGMSSSIKKIYVLWKLLDNRSRLCSHDALIFPEKIFNFLHCSCQFRLIKILNVTSLNFKLILTTKDPDCFFFKIIFLSFHLTYDYLIFKAVISVLIWRIKILILYLTFRLMSYYVIMHKPKLWWGHHQLTSLPNACAC